MHTMECNQVAVIEEMETEHVMSGDYAAANQTLELTLRTKLTEEDLDDAERFRDSLRDDTFPAVQTESVRGK